MIEELRQWQSFLLSESHVLKERPQLLFQQAANAPANSLVKQAALQRLHDGLERRMWFRLLNNREEANQLPEVTFTGHTGYVIACAFSPDASKVASGGYNAGLRVWNTSTGQQLFELRGHKKNPMTGHGVLSCDFSVDGRRIISGGDDGTIRIWDATSGTLLNTLTDHKGPVTRCVFSRDDKFILSSSGDATLKLWNSEDGSVLSTLEGHLTRVSDCSLSPDGRYIVSSSWDRTVKIWDWHAGKVLTTLPAAHNDELPDCCDFSPDGRHIVAGSGKGLIAMGRSTKCFGDLRVWEVQTGQLLFEIPAHDAPIRSCRYSPDGRMMVTASLDKTIKVWDAQNGQLLRQFADHSKGVNECVLSRDGRLMLSAGDDHLLKLRAFTISETSDSKKTFHANATICRFSSDGKFFVTGSGKVDSDKLVRLWDSATGAEKIVLGPHPAEISSLAISLDSKQIAVGTGGVVRIYVPCALTLWDWQTQAQLGSWQWNQGGYAENTQFTSDGRYLVSSFNGWAQAELKVINLADLKLKTIGPVDTIGLHSQLFTDSPCVIFQTDRGLHIRDLDLGELLRVIPGFQPIAISRNGTVAAAQEDSRIIVWTQVPDFTRVLAGHPSFDEVRLLLFSPNGDYLLSCSGQNRQTPNDTAGELKLWDVRTGREVASAFEDTVYGGVAFSPDGKYVFAVTGNGRVVGYDVPNLSERGAFYLRGEFSAFSGFDVCRITGTIAAIDGVGNVDIIVPTNFWPETANGSDVAANEKKDNDDKEEARRRELGKQRQKDFEGLTFQGRPVIVYGECAIADSAGHLICKHCETVFVTATLASGRTAYQTMLSESEQYVIYCGVCSCYIVFFRDEVEC